MNKEELFPLRVASGKRFCNREKERKFLKELIKQKRPTALISPRRYGKTSLVFKVTEELKYPFCAVDFLTAYDDDSMCNRIIECVSELISKIMPINLKTVKFLEKCFQGTKVTIGSKLIKFEFVSSPEKFNSVHQLLETLCGLDKIAARLRNPVIIFIDEFQRVLETEKGAAIQGTIRSVAQITKNIAFLFSGSSRHMLSKTFDDPNQPLYMMCEKIYLERISEEAYLPYIQSAAKIKWSKELKLSEIKRIMELSEAHPFYVNYLCSKLWQKDNPPKTQNDVNVGWEECLISEKRRLIEELDKLTVNQRLLLKEIAQTPNLKEPTGGDFLAKIRMSSGTITPILKVLKNKDMVFVDKDGVVRVLDPLMKYLLLD